MTTKKLKEFSGAKKTRSLLEKDMTLGMAVRAIRELHGLTQEELAKKVGMKKQNICDLEKGRRQVSAEVAAKIAKKLGHPETYFVKLAIQDQLRHGGLNYQIEVVAA